MKFFEICAEVRVPKFTHAEVRLPGEDVDVLRRPAREPYHIVQNIGNLRSQVAIIVLRESFKIVAACNNDLDSMMIPLMFKLISFFQRSKEFGQGISAV